MTAEHAAAKTIYQAYLSRAAVLDRLGRYTRAVVEATSGQGMTPVEPLATMGMHGGPLLCDVCRKPMVLEGGAYNRMYADEAWRRNPMKGWTSYISGGMIILTETNGTLRIYHGYPGGSGCVLVADKDLEQARAAFRARSQEQASEVSLKLGLLRAYFKAELPESASDTVLTKIFHVLFTYDPGLGINRPE